MRTCPNCKRDLYLDAEAKCESCGAVVFPGGDSEKPSRSRPADPSEQGMEISDFDGTVLCAACGLSIPDDEGISTPDGADFHDRCHAEWLAAGDHE